MLGFRYPAACCGVVHLTTKGLLSAACCGVVRWQGPCSNLKPYRVVMLDEAMQLFYFTPWAMWCKPWAQKQAVLKHLASLVLIDFHL
jgi:hypothetical protein